MVPLTLITEIIAVTKNMCEVQKNTTVYYSQISIRRTQYKVDISIGRTVNLGTERFPGQTLIRKSL